MTSVLVATLRSVDLTGRRVLVIDDEPMVRRSLRRMLERSGVVVVEACGGPEALTLLDEGASFDAAFVDLSMPEMSGDEVLGALRAKRPDLPVFILSGYVPDVNALAAAAGIITKPFTHESVKEALASCLVA